MFTSEAGKIDAVWCKADLLSWLSKRRKMTIPSANGFGVGLGYQNTF